MGQIHFNIKNQLPVVRRAISSKLRKLDDFSRYFASLQGKDSQFTESMLTVIEEVDAQGKALLESINLDNIPTEITRQIQTVSMDTSELNNFYSQCRAIKNAIDKLKESSHDDDTTHRRLSEGHPSA